MRRPPIACRRAVQSLQAPAPQHIWVPDEVLSLAVHRFFHSTCPQQKRHGSNVPGPLEARKRAAKRRMTASAGYYPQDSFPTSFSLGALFGHRSDPQTSWRYEPPSLPRNTPTLGSCSPTWCDAPSAAAHSQVSTIDPTSADCNLSQAVAQQPVDQHGSHNDIDGPPSGQFATEHALPLRTELEQSLENFKVGFAAAQSANSTQRIEGYFKQLFQQHLPSTPYLWQYCAAVLRHLDSVQGSPVPVLRVLLEENGRFLRVLNGLHSLRDCTAFLDSLDLVWENDQGRRRKPFVHRVLKVMAQLATEAEKSTTEAEDQLLLRLIERMAHRVPHTELKTLHGLAANLSESTENKLLLALFDETNLAQEAIVSALRRWAVRNNEASTLSFADAVRLMSYMPRQRLLSVVSATTLRLAQRAPGSTLEERLVVGHHSMKTWLGLIHQIDDKLLDAALGALAESLGARNNKKCPPLPDAPRYFVETMLLRQGIDLQVRYSAETLPRIQNVLAVAICQLQTQPKAYTAFLEAALPLVARHAGPVVFLRCLRMMEEKGLSLPTQTDLASVIVHELAEFKVPTASLSSGQAQEKTRNLQACKRLIKILRQAGHTLPGTTTEVRQFSNVLENARINHALPIDRRDTAVDMPLVERIALVHQLAHHYSTDTTLTQREAWRQIYFLYQYLESNSLPLGPLFTKSVAHVSITRPLLENRFVSARRLIWVCHLVARVQGDASAAHVEAEFYRQRGEIIRRAKNAYIGVGGRKYHKAHIGHMKRLGMI